MHGASRAVRVALEYYESERAVYLEETNQDDDLYAPGIPNGVPLTYLRKDVSEICVRYHVISLKRTSRGQKIQR